MRSCPKDLLVSGLMSIAAMSNDDLLSLEPLDYLAERCPQLLDLMPAVLLPANPTSKDRVLTACQLLKLTAFMSDDPWVRAAGDLLGLTNAAPGEVADLPTDGIKAIYSAYKRQERSDAPKVFDRFGREMRKLLAVRHFGTGITWLGNEHTRDKYKGIRRECICFTEFVDELCAYLDDEENLAKVLTTDRSEFIGTDTALRDSPDTDAPANEERPENASSLSRLQRRADRRLLLKIAVATCAVLVIAITIFFVFNASEGQNKPVVQLDAVQMEARYDGKDPRGFSGTDSRCADPPPSEEVRGASKPPVVGPDGKQVAIIELRRSSICPVIWGRVVWHGDPNATYQIPPGWTLHVVGHRPDTNTSFDQQEPSSPTPVPYGLGSMLTTIRGCVYVEAYFSNGEKRLSSANTSCVKP